MKEWSISNDGKPNWTTETRLKMLSIYNILQDRVDKSSAYFIRLIEWMIDWLNLNILILFLIISLVPLFASHSVSNMDIQREFESAAHDEGLLNEEENEEENEDIATNIKEYFESIGEFIGFNVVFLKNLSSGDIETIDSIKDNYGDKYVNIINELQEKIRGE